MCDKTSFIKKNVVCMIFVDIARCIRVRTRSGYNTKFLRTFAPFAYNGRRFDVGHLKYSLKRKHDNGRVSKKILLKTYQNNCDFLLPSRSDFELLAKD